MRYNLNSICSKVVHKLNLRTLSSYKIATAKDHQMSGDTSDLVDALLAMSNWCNKLLQAEEDDDNGMCSSVCAFVCTQSVSFVNVYTVCLSYPVVTYLSGLVLTEL